MPGGSAAASVRGKRVHPIGQGHEHAVPGTRRLTHMLASRPIARSLPPGRANQAAVLALHGQVLGECGLQAQVVGIAGVNPADQGLHQPLQSLAAQPAADERSQALLRCPRPAGE